MIHSGKITQEVKDRYNGLLALSEDKLYAYWLANVAVNYRYGLYLGRASERSKKLLFARWVRFMREYVALPVGSEVQ